MKRNLSLTLIAFVLVAAAACSDGDDLGSGPVPPPNPEETAITIDSVVPAEAMPGDPVEIRGSGLEEETDVVISGSTEVPQEEGAAGDGLITIKIPDDAQPGSFPIKVKRGDIESNEVVVTVVTQWESRPPPASKAMLSVSEPDQAMAVVETYKKDEKGEDRSYQYDVNIYTIEWRLPEGVNDAVLYAPAASFAAYQSRFQRIAHVKYTPELFTEADREELATAVQEGGNDNPSDFIAAFGKCTGKTPSSQKPPPKICKQLKLDANAGSIKTVVGIGKRAFTIDFIVLEYQDVDGTTKSETVEGPF